MTNKINHLAVWVLVIVHQVVGWGWYTNLRREMAQPSRPHNDRYRAHPQRRRLRFGDCYGDYCQLYAGVADRSRECHERNCRFESRAPPWFAFLFVEHATIAVFSSFETNQWPLILIDMGRPLVNFAISGLVLGAWRRPAP